MAYVSFLFFCLLSIFSAINYHESINYFSRILIVFVTFIIFLILLNNISGNNIIWLLVGLIFIESFSIFNQFIKYFNPNIEFGRNSQLIGVSANINIAGFSLAMLLPFIIQKYLESKKRIKFILLLIISLSSFSILLTGSRGASLSLTLIIIFYIFKTLFQKSSIKQKINTSTIILIPFLISVISTEILFDSMSYSYRMNQIVERGSNSRLKYYADTLESIRENPLLGIGIGNWKFNSIDKGKRHIEGYIVPYHAHNDFLQILAEIGILGFLSYVFIFLFSFYKLKSINDLYNKPILFSCLIFLIIYIIDANLNFPIARPIMQIKLALVLAIILRNEK